MVGVAALLAVSCPLMAQETEQPEPAVTLAVTGGRILTMTGEPVEGGTVLVADGKIKAVGPDLEVPEDITRIDATGKTVMPGFIDALSCLYVYPQDLNEDDEVAPQLRITDGIDPYAKAAPELLRHGVTSVHVVPGDRSLLGGMSGLLKVLPTPGPAPRVVIDVVAVRGQIGIPAGGTTSSLEKLGDYTSIREALLSTQDYLWGLQKYERDLATYERKKAEAKEKDDPAKDPDEEAPERPERPSTNHTYEAIARVLSGEVPLQIEAHRVVDMLNALRLKDEFDIGLVLLGCSEGHRIAGEIAERDVPVIVAPVSLSLRDPSAIRYGDHSRANATLLAKAGVRVALGVGGNDGLHSKFVRESAAIAVANGLDRDVALRAVTLTAAEILGVADRVGSIGEEKDADLVIIDGGPLDVLAPVQMVIVDGEVVYERGAEE